MDQETLLKNNYEIAFWVKEENDSPVKKLLAKHGGEIVKEKPIQKMRLAYPIKKENFAFFGNAIFSMAPGAVSDFKNELNLTAEILRYFFRKAQRRRASEEAQRESGPNQGPVRERGRSFFGFRSETKKTADQVLTNEALEKKIEEILK